MSVERIAFYPKRHWLLRGGVFKSADVLAPKYCGWMSKSSRVHLHLLLTGEFFLEHEEIFSLHFWCMICFLSEAEDFLLTVNRWLSSRSVTIFPPLMLNALPLTAIRGVLASALMLKLSLETQNARSLSTMVGSCRAMNYWNRARGPERCSCAMTKLSDLKLCSSSTRVYNDVKRYRCLRSHWLYMQLQQRYDSVLSDPTCRPNRGHESSESEDMKLSYSKRL